ncbi:MAG: hypothetical protein FWE70_03355 [Oscillospiraceae bacterium]|nr:hypothetical protein [Oscillospiraceae bacterium]
MGAEGGATAERGVTVTANPTKTTDTRHGASRRRGSASVFMCVVMSAILLASLVFLDISRVTLCGDSLDASLESSTKALMASYNLRLIADYGLFALEDAGDGAVGEVLAGYLGQNVADASRGGAAPYRLSEVKVEAYDSMVNPRVLEGQIIEYMKYKHPIFLIDGILGRLATTGLFGEYESSKGHKALRAKKSSILDQAESLGAALGPSGKPPSPDLESRLRDNKGRLDDAMRDAEALLASIGEYHAIAGGDEAGRKDALDLKGKAEAFAADVAAEGARIGALLDEAVAINARLAELAAAMREAMSRMADYEAKREVAEAQRLAMELWLEEEEARLAEEAPDGEGGSGGEDGGPAAEGPAEAGSPRPDPPVVDTVITQEEADRYESDRLERARMESEVDALLRRGVEIGRAADIRVPELGIRRTEIKKEKDGGLLDTLNKGLGAIGEAFGLGSDPPDPDWFLRQDELTAVLAADAAAKVQMELEKEGKELESEAESVNGGIFAILDTLGSLLSDVGAAAYDRMLIASYVMDRFNHFGRQSFEGHVYKRGEVEYVLFGFESESANVALSMAQIWALRFAIDTVDSFINNVSFEPLSRLITSICRGFILSCSDMLSLMAGKQVRLFPSVPGIMADYGDHLFLSLMVDMLIPGGKDRKLNNVMQLIQVNAAQSDPGFRLSNCYAACRSEASASVSLSFIGGLASVPIVGDMFDEGGFVIRKVCYRKY